jgi:hypothetical protein
LSIAHTNRNTDYHGNPDSHCYCYCDVNRQRYSHTNANCDS